MSFIQLYDALNLSYEEIQELKKDIEIKKEEIK